MKGFIRHIALVVPDLRQAESYYQELLDMEILGRETDLDDGLWYTVPRSKSWQEIDSAGIEIKMLALRKGEAVLALFPGPDRTGQVFAIGLTMPKADLAGVRARLSSETKILMDLPTRLHFYDRYGIMWQLELPGEEFLMHGDAHGRWLDP